MSNLIHDLVLAREAAEQQNRWVVVVIPDALVPTVLPVFEMVVPPGSSAGRTAVLEQGRLSVVGGGQPPFPNQKFDVLFLGWGAGTNEGVAAWRKAAHGELRRTS